MPKRRPTSEQTNDAKRLAALMKMLGLDRPFCRVHVSDDAILVHGSTVSAEPTIHATEPFIRLSPNATPQEIGAAILDALARHRSVEESLDEDLANHPLLGLARVPDWESFAKAFVMLSVEDRGPSWLRVVPYAGAMREEYLEKRCGRAPAAIGKLVLQLGDEASTRHREVVAIAEAPPPQEPEPMSPPDENIPEPFGYKTSWLAVRADNPAKIAKLLRAKETTPATWREGLSKAYDREALFITPSVSGWIMVVGYHLPNADLPEFMTGLQSASERLGDVFWFCTHRIPEYHVWAGASDGKVRRAYAYLGERSQTLRDFGNMTLEEKSLGFEHFDDNAESHEIRFGRRRFRTRPNEESVMQIAGAWSIDPTQIETQDDPNQRGLIVKLTPSRRSR